MLDAFSIYPRHIGADAKRSQEGFDGLVACAALARNVCSGLSQEYASIGSLYHQSFGGQPPEHLGNRGLRHSKARCDVDLARLPFGLDQVGDQLDIILHERSPPRLPRLTEAL